MNKNRSAVIGKLGISGIALYQMFLRDVFNVPRIFLIFCSCLCIFYIITVVLRKNFRITQSKELFFLLVFHIYMYFPSLFFSPNSNTALNFWKNYTMDYIIVVTVIALINEYEDCELVMKFIALGSIAMIFMMIFMPSMRHGVNRMRLAENMNSNYTGLIFAYGTFMLMYVHLFCKKHNSIALIVAGAALYSIFMTGSRKSLIMCMIFIAAYVVCTMRKMTFWDKVGFIALVAVVVYISGSFLIQSYNSFAISDRMDSTMTSDTDMARINMYKNAWDLFIKKPITGYGYQGYALVKYGGYSHSTIAELITAGGLCGTLIYFYVFITAIKNVIRTKKLANKLQIKNDLTYKLDMLIVAWASLLILFFVVIMFYGTLYQIYVSIFIGSGYSLRNKIEALAKSMEETNSEASDVCG